MIGAAISAGADSPIELVEIKLFFLNSCRFSVSPTTIGQKNDELRLLSEQETSHRKQATGNKTQKTRRKIMPQYLVANYLPDDFDPSTFPEAMFEEIHALNRELIAAGARKFACGISPAANAKTVRKQPDGRVLVTDGPYTETKEHMGGFWILEAANLDEALAWAKKAAIICDVPGEVRELLFYPDPQGATE
jgi:hypothetical protein